MVASRAAGRRMHVGRLVCRLQKVGVLPSSIAPYSEKMSPKMRKERSNKERGNVSFMSSQMRMSSFPLRADSNLRDFMVAAKQDVVSNVMARMTLVIVKLGFLKIVALRMSSNVDIIDKSARNQDVRPAPSERRTTPAIIVKHAMDHHLMFIC